MIYNLSNQKFGVEVEFSGIGRYEAAQVLESVLGQPIFEDEYYDYDIWGVTDIQGRQWKVLYDGSVNCIDSGSSNELVTPPLTYDDMETLQAVIRGLKNAGAQVDSSCGVHVHIELKNHNFDSLKRFIKTYLNIEDDLYKACRVRRSRTRRWARKMNDAHAEVVSNLDTFDDVDELKRAWYGEYGSPTHRYDHSRYVGLNLHNVWFKGWSEGTLEFRLFNESLHAGKIRAYVVFALLMNAKTLNDTAVDDYTTFEDFLNSIGMFENDSLTKQPYEHFTKHLIARRQQELEEQQRAEEEALQQQEEEQTEENEQTAV